jgi:hypothetical protein
MELKDKLEPPANRVHKETKVSKASKVQKDCKEYKVIKEYRAQLVLLA